ncbi:CocE/NonD family hydrolase, partial [Micromonospora sp. NPDC050980]|uniref:CocE/NonD family hydrolase n=1 Tax=Micromonospora sp. NPDC050980 TaxID=3155161 RepID=UPI0033C2886F
MERDLPVPMPDGVVLRADVYRPPGPGPFPVLLMRTPYDKTVAQSVAYRHPVWLARHGYLVVVQDVRGRYASGGDFEPYHQEADDGAATVEWAAALTGADGRVGTYGFSYGGAVQLLAAAARPRGLVCAAPAFTSSDFFDDWTYVGGAFNNAFIISWVMQMLALPDLLRAGDDAAVAALAEQATRIPELYRSWPLRDLSVLRKTGAAPYLFEWLAHDTRDEYWRQISIRDSSVRPGWSLRPVGIRPAQSARSGGSPTSSEST